MFFRNVRNAQSDYRMSRIRRRQSSWSPSKETQLSRSRHPSCSRSLTDSKHNMHLALHRDVLQYEDSCARRAAFTRPASQFKQFQANMLWPGIQCHVIR
jgi:hypothetical protein